jgi:hypothetical protein
MRQSPGSIRRGYVAQQKVTGGEGWPRGGRGSRVHRRSARRCARMMFRRADNVVKEVVDDRAFLLDDRGVEMIVLNPVGTMVWDALDESRDAGAIAAVLVDRFADVSLEELERDVGAFLEELREAGLVVAVKDG